MRTFAQYILSAVELCTLDELAFWLTKTGFMPPKSWKKTRRKNPVRLGCNCALFESARTWAYLEIRHHLRSPPPMGLVSLSKPYEGENLVANI